MLARIEEEPTQPDPPKPRSLPRRAWAGLTAPLRRVWESEDPLDDYTLVHMASAAGDALVGLALADSIFFSLPVGEAKTKVALYLGLTMAPLALAAPLLVPLLDHGGFRRATSFVSALGRAVAAVFAAPRLDSVLLFPLTFVLLVLSRVHALTKNGLTAAYASGALVQANARLGRMAVYGIALTMPLGLLVLQLGGPNAVLFVAAAAYSVGAFLTPFLPQPEVLEREPAPVDRRGRVADLASPAAGTAGLRGAHGFMLFLVAFALRRANAPTSWIAVLMAAGVVGMFLGDLLAPRIPRRLREEAIVLVALVAGGVGAVLAFTAFALPVVAIFVALVGTGTRLGQLAFASLMQRRAPGGAHGRVFVRYEVLFQMSWIAGAFLPAMLPIPFKRGLLILAGVYLAASFVFLVPPRTARGAPSADGPSDLGPAE
ncbi:MAG TPA: hypothetical protein VEA19_01690 [Actinomycetota bacterium]|nr:hypothetical protein [Actinomycetota bacterium]